MRNYENLPIEKVTDPFNAGHLTRIVPRTQVHPSKLKGFVYFITDGEFVKIGVSAAPLMRMAELQGANARDLKLLYVIPMKDSDDAYKIEKYLHNAYAEHRMNGEWFDVIKKLNHKSFERYYSVDKIINWLR